MLVADPALVTNDMVEDVLKYKRLDGVDAALNTIARACFAGGRQSLELEPRLGEITAPVQVIWGARTGSCPSATARACRRRSRSPSSTTPVISCTWKRPPRSTR